jgi:hypothetical protein
MDLSKTFPRPPGAKLGGIVWLPRMTDKARADAAGTLGDYRYPCPMDERLLQFLGISADAFRSAVRECPDDGAVLQWVRAHMADRTDAAIEEFNTMLAGLGPSRPESQARFAAQVEQRSPGRTDITTWFQLLDLEEGRM